MKYIRKIVSLLIAVVFLSAVAVGVGISFSVKNINITLKSYSFEADSEEAGSEITEIKNKLLNEYKGTLISFVGEKEILSCLKSEYILEDFEKIYPCTVNITIKQRREVFVYEQSGLYYVFDSEGKHIRTAESLAESYNSLDNSPNVIVADYDSSVKMETIAAVCESFRAEFLSMRSVVKSVEIIKAQTGMSTDKDKFLFTLRCGLIMEIRDYSSLTSEKISAGYRQFARLTGEQKLDGRIYCYETAEGTVRATYNPNA